jgi:hypothetical protein
MSETITQTETVAESGETAVTPTGRVRFPQIAPDTYRHPLDQQATAALRAVPGFELLASKLSQYSFERYLPRGVRVGGAGDPETVAAHPRAT